MSQTSTHPAFPTITTASRSLERLTQNRRKPSDDESEAEQSLSSLSSESLASIWSISCQSTLSLSSVAEAQSTAASLSLTGNNPGSTGSGSSTGGGPSSSGLASSIWQPLTTLTTEIPLTLTTSSTTIATSTVSAITTISSLVGLASSSVATVQTATTSTSSTTSHFPGSLQSQGLMQQASSVQGAVCAGHGVDSSAEGVLSSVLITAIVGLLIWLIFAYLRPRLPQLYAVREWFVNPELRPEHLDSGLFAFLHPPVPWLPSVTRDAGHYGESAAGDARMFPSDEEMGQRTLYIAFLMVLGWTILGLAGALPLYMASTPCLADSTPVASYGSAYSTLTDMSVVRLLKMLDNNTIATSNGGLRRRAIVDGVNQTGNAQGRLIAIVVLLIVVGVIPVLFRLFREYNKAVWFRNRWVDIRCDGQEMVWLSIRDASGFLGWSEGRIKQFLLKNGLSSGMDRTRPPRGPNREAADPLANESHNALSDEQAERQIDIHGLYTVPDTHQLAQLIEQRTEVLNELEIAETKYIESFRLTAREQDADEKETDLGTARFSRFRSTLGRRSVMSSSGRDSPAPTSYIAPKSYYKLHNVGTVTNESLVSPEEMEGSISRPSPSTPAESRGRGVSGSRFQETGKDIRFTTLPATSPPVTPIPFAETAFHGPNIASPEEATDEFGQPAKRQREPKAEEDIRQETWPSSVVVPNDEAPIPSRITSGVVFSPIEPMHLDATSQTIQPLSDFDHELPQVYNQIRAARTRLKALNAEINDLQQDGFNHIAEGTSIRGWVIFGKGIRYLPGVQLIEGRSKEDIRWGELQVGAAPMRNLLWWALVLLVGLCLGLALVAVVGLAFAGAPFFAQHLPFLRSVADQSSHNFWKALATTFAPALAGTLFIVLAIGFIHHTAKYSGKPAMSSMKMAEFKAMFAVLVIVCVVWIIVVGGLLFGVNSFSTGSGETAAVSEGTVYVAVLLMLITINAAIIAPGLLLLQPVQLWRMHRAQKKAITPRQKFRAIYPRSYNPSFGLGCCVLGVVFACTFSVIFPLIGPPIVLLVLLTMVAQRYLAHYVYGRIGQGQTGGLLHIWLIHRFATLVALQPLLLGLILLSRLQWVLSGILLGTALLIVVCVETYARHRLRSYSRSRLNQNARNALQQFESVARPRGVPRFLNGNGVGILTPTSASTRRPRTSIASVLDMISLTLAIMPSSTRVRGPLPLETEGIDDLASADRAAKTRPGAPPRLAFTDRALETAGMLYPPELLAPTPVVWLPNDANGVGRQEAYDLQRYHGLAVTLDAVYNDPRRQSTDSRRHTPSLP